MAMDLKGRLAVITGGSAGIGAATAMELAGRGARLFLGARRLEKLEEVRRAIVERHGGAEVTIAPLDVTDPASCAAFAEGAAMQGEVEILVNNAGLARGNDRVVDASEGDWREMIDTNLLGLLRITRLFLPGMIARKGGTIVQLGSVAGLEPYPGGAVYCATKAGVRALSKSLRHELLGTGVRVCTVEPGAAETEFSVVRFRGDSDRAKAVYKGYEPLTPEDVAEAIVFAITRPPHVDIEELVLFPTAQAGTMAFHRS
ncbi:SDR family NAD(P)-dependent oxidoreductase [Vulgatibacter incomptus]|uniref:Short chain dehydrogenase n=1 Tax=Vulgatibacter incomptus TaxID=1391653 RepID=A0A0K1PFK6_9BACT|nr:SDR family NAD(P)-dependent oxidoreductase [Vulgatibacter incomptus]AKU92287.1 Short chain dehydrogenase [Vulgatibacter incomptus]